MPIKKSKANSKINSESISEPKIIYGRYPYPERTERFVKITIDLLERGRYLTPSAKWLYVALRSFRNETTKKTFPSYKKIMQRSGLSRNAVAKGLAELEIFGWIQRRKSKEGGSSTYEFYYPKLINENDMTEIGDQIYPSKVRAAEWAKERRKNSKKKSDY